VAKSAPVRASGKNRFIGLIIIVAVIGVAGLGYAVSQPRAGAKTVDPNLPAGAPEGYLMGNADAPVQVIEFGDFECPVCAQWAQVTEPDVRERLIKTGIVAFRFYDFPLNIHKNNWPAHNAVACAADQGKFVEMHDQVFATQDKWSELMGVSNPVSGLTDAAKAVGVDMKAWQECFDTQKHYDRIKGNLQEGERRGIGQTPTFIIGSTMYPGQIPYDKFKQIVDSIANEKAPAAKGAKATKAAGKSGT
jgi:protein-disulfide isomerase